ncbi:hypothetical protein [Halomonas saccharevitans]|uniref:Uncharacterized protein n=1 Tax=Halomonas saccharevitans TaxID=416872 RepID=A0A1I6ZU38_9GAMM|nr:hypothetical protein [Halomonas saccharevitans]SFT66186.1 hypothetical protein SAMN04487956_11351 [Halomonas saccharevitans]
MGATPTAERVSLLVGLSVLMLATLPRYLAAGLETRQSLMLMALAVVAIATLLQWRMLEHEARARLPGLLRRLVLCLGAGAAGMTAWHALTSDFFGWELVVSHGATLGLLLHALWLWWRPVRA